MLRGIAFFGFVAVLIVIGGIFGLLGLPSAILFNLKVALGDR